MSNVFEQESTLESIMKQAVGLYDKGFELVVLEVSRDKDTGECLVTVRPETDCRLTPCELMYGLGCQIYMREGDNFEEVCRQALEDLYFEAKRLDLLYPM